MGRMKSNHILYRFYDSEDTLLYIGITGDPMNRWSGHSHDKTWYRDVARSSMEHFESRGALAAAEIHAIRTEKPRYNRTHNSVPQPPTIAAVRTRNNFSKLTSDASRFQKPDAIADDEYVSDEEREARLDELEEMLRRKTVMRHPENCPDCGFLFICEEHDGLFRCWNCLNMWTPDEWQEVRPIARLLRGAKSA